MQSQIETTVTNGSPNSSKESSLRPLTPENTKENGINHITNGSTNGSNGSDSDHNQTATSSPKPQNNGGSEDTKNIENNQDTKENSTKENQNGGSKHENCEISINSNSNGQQTMPTFQPDPNKSAFMTPNKNNEDFMLQQQPLYDQQHDMKFGKKI